MEMWQRGWRRLAAAPAWPMFSLLLIQFGGGAWILTQLAFLPIYLEERLHYAPIVIGMVIAIGQAAGMVAALLGGELTDTLGSKRVLAFGLLCGMVATLVFQTELPLLIAVLWGLAGVAGTMQTLGGSSYLTRATDPRRIGLFSAFYALSFMLGGALGNPLAGRLLDTAGFRTYGLVGLAVVGAMLLAATFLLPAQTSAAPGGAARRARGNLLELACRPEVRLLIGLRFLPTLYYGMALLLIPLQINHLAGNKTTVALYGTVSLVIASAAQLLAGRLADRFGHRWPTLICYGALIVAALGLALTFGQLWGVFVFGVLGLAAAWALATLIFCLVSDGVPRPEHGRAFGLLHATWSIAMIGGSVLGGGLTRIAAGLPFLVVGLANVASLALTLAFFAHLRRTGRWQGDKVAG
jgi:MFS family permease